MTHWLRMVLLLYRAPMPFPRMFKDYFGWFPYGQTCHQLKADNDNRDDAA